MAGVFGVQAKLGVGDSSPATVALDFSSESLAQIETISDLNGIKGTRSRYGARSRVTRQAVAGSITLTPTPVELAYLLPKILGGTPAGTSYGLGETLGAFTVQVDRVSKVFTYSGCKVNRATFRASAGQPLSLTLDIVGQTESVGNAGTFPSISIDTTTQPFIFADLALTLGSGGGNTRTATDWEWTIDNALDTERYFNSLTLVSVQPTDRVSTVRCNLPYGDYASDYAAGASGLAMTATFTNGTVSMLVSFPQIKYAAQSPTVGGRGEIFLPVNGTAFATAANNEVAVTLDSTP